MRYPNISVTVPSLLKRWKRLETGLDLSAETFSALSKQFKEKVKPWLKAEKHAQLNRHQDSTLMDIYDTITTKGMDTECI
jgi:flagellar motility protein MotE (MotC chaperone)